MSDVNLLEKSSTAPDSGFKGEANGSSKSFAAKKLNEKYDLPDIYDILIDKPLPKLNSSYAKAFEVIDKKQKGFLYALILPNTLPIRFSTLQKLRKIFHISMSNIIDAGFTEAGQGKYGNFAIVCERPLGIQLAEYIKTVAREIKEDGTKDYFLSEDFIAKKIVEPINDILKTLEAEDLSHGNINHNNIFIDTADENNIKIKLLEPVSQPCGLSQLYQSETIHRAQATPLGKGESTIKDDYFA